MPIVRVGCLVALCVAALAAHAQRADCPIRSAAVPTKPPGPPPSFTPTLIPPARFGDPLVAMPPPPPVEMDRNVDGMLDAEEGFVSQLAWEADAAVPQPSARHDVSSFADLAQTELGSWRMLGYSNRPHPDPLSLTRYFSKDGGLVSLREWHMAKAGGAVYSMRPPAFKMGDIDAYEGGIRAPSGCVIATLTWTNAGTNYTLAMVGPWTLAEQRQKLASIARSLAAR